MSHIINLDHKMPRKKHLFFFLSFGLTSLLLSVNVYAVNVIVKISGVDTTLRRNIDSYLTIQQQKNLPDLSIHRLKILHKKAPKEIKKALQPFGFYQPVINENISNINNLWKLSYHITPGPPTTIQKIDIHLTGQDFEPSLFSGLIESFPLKVGDRLVHSRYEEGKQSFLRTAIQQGYFNAKYLTHKVHVNRKTHNARIALDFEPGDRYHFGPIHFYFKPYKPGKKIRRIKSSLLNRYLSFSVGDHYQADKLVKLQSDLTASDYFSNIAITPRRDLTTNKHIPFDIELTSRNKHHYTLGAGYGTNSGPRGRIGWENRQVNSSGHRLNAEGRTSLIRRSLSTSYHIPIKDPRTDRFSFTAAWLDDNPKTSKSRTRLLSIRQALKTGKHFLRTLYINNRHDTFDVGNSTGKSNLLLPGASWVYTRSDGRLVPRNGARVLVDIKGTHPDLGSDTNFIFMQFRTTAKFIFSPTTKGRVLLRGDLGVSRISDIAELPASLRFFTGGDSSVRGYGYNSLGAKDTAGNIIGGEQLVVGSFEYEHTISDLFSMAVFVDTGNAINDWNDALEQGAGFGFRWKTPIGLIRTDFAWAISKNDNPFRFHLVIGPDL